MIRFFSLSLRTIKRSSWLMAVLFSISATCCAVSSWFDTKESIQYYLFLTQVKTFVTDETSKEVIQSVLDKPELLDDQLVEKRVKKIINRVLLADLLMSKLHLLDDATKKVVQSWLDNQLLLDDLEVRKKANIILERVKCLQTLKEIANKITRDKDKKLLATWLADPRLLDNAESLKRADEMIWWVCKRPLLTSQQRLSLGKDVLCGVFMV